MTGGLLPESAAIAGPDEIDGMRRRLAAAPEVPRSGLRRDDDLAELGVFRLVVVSTFPVALPFMLVQVAMTLSRAVTLAMLFLAGFALGRYAVHPRPLLTGSAMLLLGAVLIGIVMAPGG